MFLKDLPDDQAHGKEISRVWQELAGTTALWQPAGLIEITGID